MILALLVGAILAKLFLRSQPLQLLQVSIYNFAEWLWRFVYYFLVCITGPKETDESLWNPGWRPTVTADNWRDEYKAVPDPYPNIPRATPSGSFHRSDRRMPNVVVPKDEPDDVVPLSSTKMGHHLGTYQYRSMSKFPQMVGHLEPSSDDDDQVHDAPSMTRPTLTPMPSMGNTSGPSSNDRGKLVIMSASTSEEEPDLPQVAAMRCNTPLGPPGEPMIIWKTYGLSVPLSLYNDSHQVRKALMDKVQETRSQQTGAKLCAFSRKNKEMTYAEAYENKGFRKWYLDRLHGPKASLSPLQRDFAIYCAEREETEWNFYKAFFPVGQQRLSQLNQTQTARTKTVPQSSERPSSSNEQPLRKTEADECASTRVAFLSNFNKRLAQAPPAASSSRDDASVSSFSVLSE